MEQSSNAIAMLELMNRAAFCVKDGRIINVNSAAKQHNLQTGTAISDILLTGVQEYADFSGGCLYLTLKLANASYGASVTRLDSFDVFLLEQEEDQAQLQGMALAAQELRQPLSNIMTIADHLFPLSDKDMDPEYQDQTARINRGLFQMLRIISNMSDAYRYYQNETNWMETRNVCVLLEELFAQVKPLISHAGITLNYTGLQEDIYCLIDCEKLERAVSNLLSNALKFSAKGDTIDAKLTRKGTMLYLTVQDTGSGVEEAIKGNVFCRYRREPGIEDSRHGIGLGMVLIRSAAAAHGGTVLMEQSAQTGTKITMTLSIQQSSNNTLRTHMLHVDYAGERDHPLLELSESLPADLYQ